MKLFDDIYRKIKRGWNYNTFYNQLENQVNPYITCACCSALGFLQNAEPEYFKSMNPDDVTREINNKKYMYLAKDLFGYDIASRYEGKLNQLWLLMEHYLNDKLFEVGSKRRCKFFANDSIYGISEGLRKGAVMVSTAPIFNGERLGHVMLAVDMDINSLTMITDDSFGDWTSQYKTGHINTGDNVKSTISQFEGIFRSFSIRLI